MTQSKYYKKKEEIRQEAIEWQQKFTSNNYSYLESMEWGNYFYNLGKRYGLLREFKENGIC